MILPCTWKNDISIFIRRQTTHEYPVCDTVNRECLSFAVWFDWLPRAIRTTDQRINSPCYTQISTSELYINQQSMSSKGEWVCVSLWWILRSKCALGIFSISLLMHKASEDNKNYPLFIALITYLFYCVATPFPFQGACCTLIYRSRYRSVKWRIGATGAGQGRKL